MQDSGLLVSMLDRDCASKILAGELGCYNGAIFENIIADCFSKQDRKLYYFHKDSGLEIVLFQRLIMTFLLLRLKLRQGIQNRQKRF